MNKFYFTLNVMVSSEKDAIDEIWDARFNKVLDEDARFSYSIKDGIVECIREKDKE